MAGNLIGGFLGGTKFGRFLWTTILAAIVIVFLFGFSIPLGKSFSQSLIQGDFLHLMSHAGINGQVLTLFWAMMLAILAATIILFILLWSWDKSRLWFWSFPLASVIITTMILWRCRAGTDYPLHEILPIYEASWLIIIAMVLPMAMGFGTYAAVKQWRYGQGPRIRGTERLSDNPRKIEKRFLALAKKECRNTPWGVALWEKVILPFIWENMGIMIVGSPGSGKTQVVFPIMLQTIARKNKTIVWDLKGSYTQALAGKPGVKILSAWDSRSLFWRLGADIQSVLDCKEAAAILIEKKPESQPYFRDTARQILEAVLLQFDAMGHEWGWQDVWNAVSQGKEHLRRFLQRTQEGRSAANALEGEIHAAYNVYSTLITALQPISSLGKAWGNQGESLRKWLKDPTSNVLIIGGMVEYKELATLTAKLALQLLVNEVLSMPEDLNRRIWFFLDELSALEYHQSLIDAFTTGRSHGLCAVIGIQDIGRIENIYGQALAKSLINTFNTNIFMRCSDAPTSEWAAAALGKQEAFDLTGETSNATFDKSKNRTVRTKPVFMASEISNFHNLTGALRIGNWPVAKVTWQYHEIFQVYPRVEKAAWVNEKAKLDDPPKNYPLKTDAPQPPKDDKPVPPKPQDKQKPDQDDADESWRSNR